MIGYLKPGSVYDEGGKRVLVFGVAKSNNEEKEAGIGVDLNTGKVEDVSSYSSRVFRLEDLTFNQAVLYGKSIAYLKSLQENKIVAITGKARSGKDTFASRLMRCYGYTKISLGDPIIKARSIIYGNSDKKERDQLILIGQGLRKFDEFIWIKAWLREAIDHLKYNTNTNFVVPDLRQPDEYTFFKSLSAYVVRIEVNEEQRLEVLRNQDGEYAISDELLNDETEQYTNTLKADLTVFNDYKDNFKYFKFPKELITQ